MQHHPCRTDSVKCEESRLDQLAQPAAIAPSTNAALASDRSNSATKIASVSGLSVMASGVVWDVGAAMEVAAPKRRY